MTDAIASRVEGVLGELRALGKADALAGMAHYGIRSEGRFGVSVPNVRAVARRFRRDHELALALWGTGIGEARILAAMVDDPAQVTLRQMERWAGDLDSWDVCDGLCSELLRKTPYAHQKAGEWSGRKKEFVKRAGFVLMATLAVHDTAAADAVFVGYLGIIEREAGDGRNFVKKAVNWALRQIGKRNARLNREAVRAAERIRKQESSAARWVAADALRELRSDAVQSRLAARGKKRT
ncbi:MAG: DNA alkylation repair protein [Dehalococcoidia bacterium]